MINPATWPREHKLALAIAAAIGAVIGVVVGYIAQAAGSGAEGSVSFNYWIHNPVRMGGLWWGIVGALVGTGIIYVKCLMNAEH